MNTQTRPIDFLDDNGYGMPTHVPLKSGKWIATPAKYRWREDGLMSHKYLRCPETREFEWVEVPSTDEIEDMVADGTCEDPWGEIVEPDHPRSWLRILGLI